MRNRLTQPAPLDLPPADATPVRIYGQLIGPMLRPEAYVKILLRAITTTQQIVQDTWSECTTDTAGNYDFSVNPGKYAVFFERAGIKTRVNNIQVYSDSAPGDLQSFMLSPAPELLTPLVVLEAKAILESTSAAMLRARQWAENPVDVPVLDFEQGAGPEYSAYHWAHKAQEIVDTDTNINWREEWSSTTAYAFRDAVRYQGSSYYCIEDNTGETPPTPDIADSQFWSLMARKGDDGSASTEPGPPGPANTLTIGTVEAVPNGTPPTVTITGQSPAQVLNFQLETGAKGADSTVPGPKGDPGPPGPAGSPVVDPGAVGSWALVSTQDLVLYSLGQYIPASNLRFIMMQLLPPGPDWAVYNSATIPAGTWRLAADVNPGGTPGNTLVLAQRTA